MRNVCLRVNVSKQQNEIIENAMALQGYRSKAQFLRESVLNNSPALQQQIRIINQKLDRIIELLEAKG